MNFLIEQYNYKNNVIIHGVSMPEKYMSRTKRLPTRLEIAAITVQV